MAKYKISIKRSAAKEIKQLSKKVRQRIVAKIAELAEDPRPHGCKKLSHQERYRLRWGNYRILYAVEDTVLTVHVVKVAHRREVYR